MNFIVNFLKNLLSFTGIISSTVINFKAYLLCITITFFIASCSTGVVCYKYYKNSEKEAKIQMLENEIKVNESNNKLFYETEKKAQIKINNIIIENQKLERGILDKDNEIQKLTLEVEYFKALNEMLKVKLDEITKMIQEFTKNLNK